MATIISRIKRVAGMLRERPLRRAEYDERFSMSLRQWLIMHQKEIVFDKMTWMGTKIWKNPFDIWIYQEILHEIKPDVVIEIGSAYGGSTRYLADLLDLLGNGMVVSIDIDRSKYHLEHKRVIALTGNSSDPGIISRVEEICSGKKTMIIQDGGHSKAQVLSDLENYSRFVSLNSYFIVEDGIVDLFYPEDGLGFSEQGPLAAIEEFVSRHPEFQVDESRERYLMTYNPKGFLRRISV
ncbi:MAG TPA: cephalosporin hydroxylase [Desulfobacteraceae bacterium]|nr:cephalosporin hydroxylase [Desulfobacteraceae bacterium]